MAEEVTNLDRAMAAEIALQSYSDAKEGTQGGELYDVGESVCIDAIADICHLLHLDEKTAGCKTPEQIRSMLDTAFNHFMEEVKEEANAA